MYSWRPPQTRLLCSPFPLPPSSSFLHTCPVSPPSSSFLPWLPCLSVLYLPPSTFISSPPSLCHRSFQREFPSRDLDSVLQTATSPPEGFEPWRTACRVSAKNCVTPLWVFSWVLFDGLHLNVFHMGACVSLCCIRYRRGLFGSSKRNFSGNWQKLKRIRVSSVVYFWFFHHTVTKCLFGKSLWD